MSTPCRLERKSSTYAVRIFPGPASFLIVSLSSLHALGRRRVYLSPSMALTARDGSTRDSYDHREEQSSNFRFTALRPLHDIETLADSLHRTNMVVIVPLG
jgi:hypothetical protein